MARFGASLRIMLGLYGGAGMVAYGLADGDIMWIGVSQLAAFVIDYVSELGG